MQLRLGDHQKSAGKPVSKRPQPPALASFWLTALIATAIVLLLVLGAILLTWVMREEAYAVRHLESCSAMLVRDLGNRSASLQGRLREWHSDPRLQAVLRDGDPARLRSVGEELTRQLPDAFQVRLIPLEAADGTREGLALSYAGLDLLQQAARERSVTALEVHRLGHSDAHLAIAGPVLDPQGGEVLGVVHVALPLSTLPAAQDAGGDWGRILFQQKAGDHFVDILHPPGQTPPTGEPGPVIDVPGTRLRIAAWVDEASLLDRGLLVYGGLGYLLTLLLVALAMYLPSRRMLRSLALDQAGLVALVDDAANRRPLRRLQWQLAETQPVAEVLLRLLRPVQPPVPGDAGPEPVAAAPGPASGSGPPLVSASAEKAAAAPQTPRPAQPQRSRPVVELDLDAARPASEPGPEDAPAEIFRAYDIRGVVDLDLTADVSRAIGRAIAAEAEEAGDQTVVVARDTRASGVGLAAALVEGLRAGGCDVLDLGLAPTPLLYFATRYQGETSGVMVTGSHNPARYNGLKVVIGGLSIEGERITGLRDRILAGDFSTGGGHYRQEDLVGAYIDHVDQDVAIARTLKVVIDCGNGAAAVVAPQLYRALGCDLVELNCDPTAGFPDGRVPDPTRLECLEALREAVVREKADLGLAFDGDGDRLGVVDCGGKVIWPDRVLMLFAADVLSRHPGTDVIFDVKSSHHLATEILRHGGRPVMWKAGHSPLKTKLLETGALLAGEWSGHIIFQERWYGFDDALYAGARLLEVLALDPRPSSEVFAALPEAQVSTPELFVSLPEGEPARIMREVLKLSDLLDGVAVKTIDGLRAEFDAGWGLVRASNTQPALVFRFEADDEVALARIQALIRRVMERAAPGLELPF